jgi:hypothetical protein
MRKTSVAKHAFERARPIPQRGGQTTHLAFAAGHTTLVRTQAQRERAACCQAFQVIARFLHLPSPPTMPVTHRARCTDVHELANPTP